MTDISFSEIESSPLADHRGSPSPWLVLIPLLLAGGIVLLAAGPEDAPFSGDNGMKMWQSVQAWQGLPELPRQMPQGLSADRFPPPLTVSGTGVLRGVFAYSFPWVVGHAGLGSLLLSRIWILLATLISIPLLARLIGAGPSRGGAAFLLGGLAPYAVVYWEHGPSVSLLVVSFLLFRRTLRGKGWFPWWLLPLIPAVRWRPEMLPAAAGFWAACMFIGNWEGRRQALLQLLIAAAAAAGGLLVFGRGLLGIHLLSNLPGSSGEFFQTRAGIFDSWFVPSANRVAMVGIALWLAGIIVLLQDRCRGAFRRSAYWMASLGAGAVFYYFLRGSLGEKSMFSLCPGLLLLPLAIGNKPNRRGKLLAAAWLVGTLFIFVLSPIDGFFQYGPRLLLAPLVLGAASLVAFSLESGHSRRWAVAVVAAAAAISVVSSTRAIIFEEYFKRRHGQLSDFILSLDPGVVICTDEDWLPVAAWKATMTRPVLLMDDTAEASVPQLEGSSLIWLSSRSSLGGAVGESGYRGLRLSVRSSGRNLPGVPGPLTPQPPRLAL